MKVSVIAFISTLLFSCGPYQEISVSKIEDAHITKLDKDGIEAEIKVQINNPNKVGFTIFKSNVDVKMNDNTVGVAHLKKNVRISANKEDVYTFVVSSKFDKLASGTGGIFGLLSMAMSKNVNISLKGDLKAGKFLYRKKFPIDKKQKVPLFK